MTFYISTSETQSRFLFIYRLFLELWLAVKSDEPFQIAWYGSRTNQNESFMIDQDQKLPLEKIIPFRVDTPKITPNGIWLQLIAKSLYPSA